MSKIPIQREPKSLLRRSGVEILTGLSRSSIYAKMADGTFPRPVQIGTRSVAWRSSDIDDWMESLPETGEVRT
jgi:prophage regulatory protein